MRVGWILPLLSSAAWGQAIPPEKGSQPDWDSGTPIESAFIRCRNCHDRDSTPELTLYMPFDGWVSTMMGNAQRDPLFRAAVAVANQDVPGIGQWCLRCHSPQAYVTGHTLPADGGAFVDLDYEGVTCDVCHRSIVPPTEPGAPYVGNAQLYFDTTIKKFGPYPDLTNSGHEGALSPFTGSSELCGQCHSIHNPVGAWRAADGGTLGPRFPLDTTYEEWKQSAFARLPRDAGYQSCADCHLPRFTGPDGGTNYLTAKLGDRHTRPRQHTLVGGNVWGIDAVKAANPELAGFFPEQFAQTRKFAIENLQKAASLVLTVPSEAEAGSTASVTVRVTNLSGHKLPTGYADGRRVVIQLAVDSKIVSGAFDAGALLPDSQLHVYEVQHGRAGIGTEEHLALHDTIVSDSRIPPAAFIATPQTRPVGVSWFDLPDGGFADTDLVTFSVPLKASLTAGASVKVTARLMFQSTTPEYVAFLLAENHTDDAGRLLADVYEQTGRGPPIEMAKAEASVAISRFQPVDHVPSRCGCSAGPGLAALLGLLGLWMRRRSRQSS